MKLYAVSITAIKSIDGIRSQMAAALVAADDEEAQSKADAMAAQEYPAAQWAFVSAAVVEVPQELIKQVTL